MKNKDMIYELKNIKNKMRDFGYTINRLVKELDHRIRLKEFKLIDKRNKSGTNTSYYSYSEEDVKEFIKIIEKKVNDYRMYADLDNNLVWQTSTISPQDAKKRAKYCEELLDFILEKVGDLK